LVQIVAASSDLFGLTLSSKPIRTVFVVFRRRANFSEQFNAAKDNIYGITWNKRKG